MLNCVSMVGNLVKDPEFRTSPTGKTYSTFTIANDDGRKNADGKSTVLYIECVIFGKQAETIAKHFRKGSTISIVGRLVPNKYTAKDGEEHNIFRITCDRFDFVSVASGNRDHVTRRDVDEPTEEESFAAARLDPSEDDLPF